MAKLRSRTFDVAVQVKFVKGPGADVMYRALTSLAHNPTMIAKLVKVALAETVLRAYEQRFKAAEPLMTHMEPLGDANKKRRLRAKRRQKIMQDFAERTRDQIEAATKGAEKAKDPYADLWDTYEEMTKRDDFDVAPDIQVSGKSSEDPKKVAESVLYRGGRGRALLLEGMAEVLRLIAGSSAMRVSTVGGRTVIGLGNLAALERIRTPSYTEYAKGKKTGSNFTVLWRQLEYGTGYYARPERYKSWWRYGTGSGKSRMNVRVKGSRGGHFLRTATGLPYEADAVRFQGVFNTMLVQALAGKAV